MNAKPWAERVFILVAVPLWLIVTVASAVVVVQAPAENTGLAIGVILIWVAMLVFVAATWITRPGGPGGTRRTSR